MKSIKNLSLAIIAITTLSCSKDDNNSNPSNTSCNEIVCGYIDRGPAQTTFTILRGTLEPDTCGIETLVNKTTYTYYKNKLDALPTSSEGFCCWEGLK